jgi:hypothetical protein
MVLLAYNAQRFTQVRHELLEPNRCPNSHSRCPNPLVGGWERNEGEENEGEEERKKKNDRKNRERSIERLRKRA